MPHTHKVPGSIPGSDIFLVFFATQTAKATHFESKEWEFVVVDKDRNGKKKVLAKASVNMSQYTDLAVDTRVTLDLKPVSKKIGSVALDISLVAEFIKEGKAT